MKKLVIVIFALIFWNTNVFAKEEIRSRFGFYITAPSNFIAVQNQNLDDLLKKYKGPNLDKKALWKISVNPGSGKILPAAPPIPPKLLNPISSPKELRIPLKSASASIHSSPNEKSKKSQ